MALVGAPSPIVLLMRKKVMPRDTNDFPNPMKQIGIRTDFGTNSLDFAGYIGRATTVIFQQVGPPGA